MSGRGCSCGGVSRLLWVVRRGPWETGWGYRVSGGCGWGDRRSCGILEGVCGVTGGGFGVSGRDCDVSRGDCGVSGGAVECQKSEVGCGCQKRAVGCPEWYVGW